MPPAPSAFLLAAGVLALLLVARAHIMHRPEARLWQRVRPLLFNGLYLDEAFTRITFTLWPPKPRARREQPEPAPIYPDEGVSS
jgi:NAD(P)H-quinone oxidoreductase subunit 5